MPEQPALQIRTSQRDQLINRVVGLMDLVFPVSTALLFAGQKIAAAGLLVAWLIARLIMRQRASHGLYGLLLVLALFNAGILVMDRGAQPSDPSDLLLIGLAFAAGLERTVDQWQRSFVQIVVCILPIGLTGLLWKPTQTLLQFPDINVNRLSFLLGILTVLAWGLNKLSRTTTGRVGWLAVTSSCVPLALLTGSRAALAAPALAILLTELGLGLHRLIGRGVNWKRHWRTTAAMALVIALAVAGTAGLWYRNDQEGRINQLSDAMRFPTSLCWASAPFNHGNPLLGLGYNREVRRHCDGRALEVLASAKRMKGLPHAHNVPAQILGETGLIGLSGLILGCFGIARQVARNLRPTATIQASQCAALTTSIGLPLCAYFVLTGMTTSFEIYLPLNQVLIGYSLAALFTTQSSSSQETNSP